MLSSISSNLEISLEPQFSAAMVIRLEISETLLPSLLIGERVNFRANAF